MLTEFIWSIYEAQKKLLGLEMLFGL